MISAAWAESYELASGKKQWAARWRERDGTPRKKRGFRTKGDALRYAQEQTSDERHGRYVSPGAASTTVGELWPSFIRDHDVGERSLREYRLVWKNHIQPELAKYPLADAPVRQWSRRQKERWKPATADKHMNMLSAFFTYAVEQGFLLKNPMSVVERMGMDYAAAVDRIMTVDEVNAMMGMSPNYAILVPIGAYCGGARYGEAAGLRVDRIDLDAGLVHITSQYSRVLPGHPLHPGTTWTIDDPPKGWHATRNPYPKRTVPLPLVAARLFREHIELGRHDPVTGLLGASSNHRPNSAKSFTVAWNRQRDKVFGKGADWPTFHDLRHFYVSLLIANGVDELTIQRYIGHKPGSPVTRRIYGHLWPDAADRVRTIIDASATGVGAIRARNIPLHAVDGG